MNNDVSLRGVLLAIGVAAGCAPVGDGDALRVEQASGFGDAGGITEADGPVTLPAPANDLRANALIVSASYVEGTVVATTIGATHDGPAVSCACTSGPNVWYRFTLARTTVVYFDTAGSEIDTSLFVTDSAGVPVPGQADAGNSAPGLCNDDSGCAVGDFTSPLQSRLVGLFVPGTYYLAVGGCGPQGKFTLHSQGMEFSNAARFFQARLAGDGAVSAVLPEGSMTTGSCGGAASGEDARWFLSCGATPTFFSLCASDGGTYSRRIRGIDFDPTLYVRSEYLAERQLVCNDDGVYVGGTNCAGTGGDTLPYGSRLNNVTVSRGINTVLVDSRTGTGGMTYTLRYNVP